jgi:hypothetical protein
VTRTFDTPQPPSLKVELPAGEIEVVTEAELTQTTVELEARRDDEDSRDALRDARIELRDSALGGPEVTVVVSEQRRWFGFGRGPEFRLRIRAPFGSTLAVRTRSADLDARGIVGELDLQGTSGDVRVEHVDRETRVKVVSGDVQVGHAGGEAEVNTVSGDVVLRVAGGRTSITTVSGDLTVREALDSLTANSVSGDQRIDSVLDGRVSLQSVSGDVRVGVRRGSGVHLDISSMSGDVESELVPGDDPGAADGPVVELKVKTLSGDVDVVRAPAGADLPAA